MSPAEVAYRTEQMLIAQLQQRGLAAARHVSTPDLFIYPRPFIAIDAPAAPERYVAAAQEALAGDLEIFANRYHYGERPSWNRDAKTGRTAPLTFGKTLDYRDATLVGDIKYLWEPNRHLHLVTLAQGYRLTEQRTYLDGVRTQLESWLDQCPYMLGPNWSSSLELAVRLINWSIVWQLIGGVDSPLFSGHLGEVFRKRWVTSVYQHMHFIRGHLSKYSSGNNHLIGELSGLFVASHTWPFWPEIKEWRRYAKRHLAREALRQNAPDGVNREQAVSYQQFVLDFLLLSALAGQANGDDFPVEYWQRIERMLEFIAAIMDVRGNVPMIGDADDGYVVRLSQEADFCPYRSLLATGAALFSRSDFKAKAGVFDDKSLWLLGNAGAARFEELKATQPVAWRRDFPEGGYYVLGGDFDTEREVRIVVDAGPLGYLSIAAHGHADALAFTLSLGGTEFLIDPGTYAYHTEREWRDYFRGTAAHNTVSIDGENQSTIGGSFLWTHHARAECELWQPGVDSDRFVGSHDGYQRLEDPVQHRRALIYDKALHRLTVSDLITCAGTHRVERFWHFAENVKVAVDDDGTAIAERGGHRIRLVPGGVPAKVKLYRGESSPPRGWVSRRFDVKVPATTLVWETEIKGTTRLDASIECSFASEEGSRGTAEAALSL